MQRLLVRAVALSVIAASWSLVARYFGELEQVLRQATAWMH